MTVSGCRFRVTGKVQGVFFRASTASMARKLTLTGYAHNLPDGSVEVLACGETDGLQQLGDWLWQGSVASTVSGVDRTEVTPHEMNQSGWPPPTFSTA